MRQLPVRFLEGASADLSDLIEFLCSNGASFATAEAYVDRIVERCFGIGSAPQGYPLNESLGPGVRTVPFETSAKIAYRVLNDTVEITNVFYGGQDIDNKPRRDRF